MRVFIAGAGHAGLSVAAHLRTLGHEVVIVDRDPSAAKRAFEQHGLVSLSGDATSAALLRDADVGRADVVVAMLRRDADNLAVALLAQAAGAKRVMVRMRDSEYRAIYQAAGISRILSETDVLIGAFATAVEHEAVHHSMVLGGGESIAVELVVPMDAAVAEQTVKDLAADPGFPASCVISGISGPDGGIEAPRGATVVRGGLSLLVVTRRDDIAVVVEFFTRPRAPRAVG